MRTAPGTLAGGPPGKVPCVQGDQTLVKDTEISVHSASTPSGDVSNRSSQEFTVVTSRMTGP
ncbi:MAG TPA: hypothetical protein VHR72_10520 [Gemmataceae bacterium]|nr:hypothetical protein [Gemmataceae bacterium]